MKDSKIDFIDLKSQYEAYRSEIDSELHRHMASASFIMGEPVARIENELSAYTGASHCIGCSSGTDAIMLCLMALGIGPGDEVITSPFTFFATAEVPAFLGARPVFADILPGTLCIDPSKIEERITPSTRAIIPVGIFGQPPDMDPILETASKHGIAVIEDAAQSFGAVYKGRKSCNLSRYAATSFFPAKPLGCYGDGGAVFTDDESAMKKMRSLLNHGQGERYRHRYIGINGRLDALQAAVLSVKLKHYSDELKARSLAASRYTKAFTPPPEIKTQIVPEDRTSTYAQYTIMTEERESLAESLRASGIPTAVHYPVPVYAQEAMSYLKADPAEYPVTEETCKKVISLPMGPFLAEDVQNYIIESVLSFFGGA